MTSPRITVIHSNRRKCGVREYGVGLDASFRKLEAIVDSQSYDSFAEAVTPMQKGDVLLVHYEQNLVHIDFLHHYLQVARDKGAHTVLCCHVYWRELLDPVAALVDRFVLHRHYDEKHPQSTIIPLACPVYAPEESRPEIRRRLGLPEDRVVMTTLGFLVYWKQVPEMLACLLEEMKRAPGLFIHLHTPWPFGANDPEVLEPRIRTILDGEKGWRRKVKFSTEFLPAADTLDIAYASDVGFLFHGHHTGSVSAATKQFVSARRPLCVTGSTHAADLRGGIHKVETFDPPVFAHSVVKVAQDEVLRRRLGREMELEYGRLNMDAVAGQYLELCAQLRRKR